MSKVDVGDRVIVIEDYCSARVGMTGTVIGMKEKSAFDCAVCFDEPFPGANSCGGKCDRRLGQFMKFFAIERIDDDCEQPFKCDEEVRFY